MLDLTNRYVVANHQGQHAVLSNGVDYHSVLSGDWFYVVGGLELPEADLPLHIAKSAKAYAAYEPEF